MELNIFITITPSTYQEDETILSYYAPKKQSIQIHNAKLIDLKGEIDESIIVVREFNTNLLVIDRTNRNKFCENTVEIKQNIKLPNKQQNIHCFLMCVWNIYKDKSHFLT